MVYCIILPVLLARFTVSVDVKKNKRCRANDWKRVYVKNKWNWVVEIENEVKWFSDVYVTFSYFNNWKFYPFIFNLFERTKKMMLGIWTQRWRESVERKGKDGEILLLFGSNSFKIFEGHLQCSPCWMLRQQVAVSWERKAI